MMKNNIIPDFWGECKIHSSLELETLAQIISTRLLGNVQFTYGKHSIWEEIPSMYIEHNILGLLIIIGGYGGSEGYVLNIQTYGEFDRYLYKNEIETNKVNLSHYLYQLLSLSFQDNSEIQIIAPVMFPNC